MNIHEYQAKKLLKKFGAPVPNGVHGSTTEEILNKTKLLNTEKYVLTVSYTHLTLPTKRIV